MGRIKFEVTESLEKALSKVGSLEAFRDLAPILEKCLQDKLLPYAALKEIRARLCERAKQQEPPVDSEWPLGKEWSLENLLRGTRITFRPEPVEESAEAVAARESAEELQYERMLRRRGERETLSEAQEWREARRGIARIVNALLSIFGTGVAVFLLSHRSLAWSIEWCILLTITSSTTVAVAEIFLALRENRVV